MNRLSMMVAMLGMGMYPDAPHKTQSFADFPAVDCDRSVGKKPSSYGAKNRKRKQKRKGAK